jgi:hypothetical protein
MADVTGGGDFKKALAKLANDADYRTKATNDPTMITKDFHLNLKELHALRQAAVLSGTDMRAVDKVQGADIASRAAQFTLARQKDWDVSCCSCCCCCCGETAVA